jgi:hypothetical protein
MLGIEEAVVSQKRKVIPSLRITEQANHIGERTLPAPLLADHRDKTGV